MGLFVLGFSLAQGQTTASCRAQIRKSICAGGAKSKDKNRTCEPVDPQIAVNLESLFDQFPSQFQRMFCFVSGFQIVDTPGPLVSSRLIADPQRPGHMMGAQLFLRRDFLLRPGLTWGLLASWREQALFGGATSDIQLNPILPVARANFPNVTPSGLFLPVAEEFARLLDSVNHLNRWTKCGDSQDRCLPVAGSWGAISWLNQQQPKVSDDFPRRQQLCFEGCAGSLWQSSDVDEAYNSLIATDFINLQASASPGEDFAQTMAGYALWMQTRGSVVVRTSTGLEIDFGARLRQPQLVKKFAAIERLLRSPLKYPGQD